MKITFILFLALSLFACGDDFLYTANGDGFGFGYMWADIVVGRIAGDTEVSGVFQ